MKCLSIVAACLCCAAFAMAAARAAENASLATPGRRFVCTDYTQGKVMIISPAGVVEWEYPAPGCDDVWVLPSGNVLFTVRNGVKEVTRDGEVVFSYETSSEVYACQRLPGGNTFIGECNAGRLLEVSPTGEVLGEIRLLPAGKDGGHGFMRNARRLASGNYLVALYSSQVVREYSPQGEVLREIPAPGGAHSVVRLPNGNTLIACGDLRPEGRRVIEVDPAGKIVWEISSADLPGIELALMTGLQRLPNGNTLMTNWLGHGKFGTAPHLIEVTPEKKVVWTYGDHQAVRTMSSVQAMDVPGDATRHEVWH